MIILLSRMISAMSYSRAQALGRFFGRIWYYLIPIRRGVAKKNIQRVFGDTLSKKEKKKILKDAFANVAMFGVESLRVPALTTEIIEQTVEIQGFEHWKEAHDRGKGVVMVSGHFGSFDYSMASFIYPDLPVHVILKDIKWKPAHDFIFAARKTTGLGAISTRRAKERILELLHAGHAVGFAVDQHMPSYRGIVTSFFGQLVSTSPAPARFAYETGASIIPVTAWRDEKTGKQTVRVEKILELESPYDDIQANIRHNTERINSLVEGWIKDHPAQWLWMHKRWKVQDNPEGWDIPPQLQHLLTKSYEFKA